MANKKDIQILIDLEVKNQKTLSDISSGLKNMGRIADDTKSSTSSLFGEMFKGSLASGLVMSAFNKITASIQGMADTMVQATMQSAKTNQLMSGFARNFGNDVVANLGKLRKASGGTISDMQLMQSANKASLLGVSSNVEDLAGLMTTARLRAKEMGMDSTQAFNDIVTGIGRGSPLILDNLGIKIPDALKKQMESMNDLQKTQALTNFAIQDGINLQKQYGETNLTVAEQFQRISASSENLLTSLGNLGVTFLDNTGLLSTYGDILDGVTGGLNWLAGAFDGVLNVIGPALQPALDRLAQTWADYTGNINISRESLQAFADFMVNTLANGLIFIIDLITKGVQVLQFFQQHWEMVSNASGQASQNIVNNMQWLSNTVVDMENAVIGAIEGAINASIEGVVRLVNQAIQSLKALAAPLKLIGVDVSGIQEVGANKVSFGRVARQDVGATLSKIGRGGLAGGQGNLAFKMGAGDIFNFDKNNNKLGGGGAGGAGGDKASEEAKKRLDELEQAKVDAIADEEKRKIAQIELDAKRELDAFKGTESEKAEFKKLLDIKTLREINDVKAEYDKKEADEAKRKADEKKRDAEKQQSIQDKLRQAEIDTIVNENEKKQAQAKFNMEKELRDFEGNEKQKQKYKLLLEKEYQNTIMKQQMAENINFYGVRDIDTAISKLQSFVEKGLSAKLLNNALGS